MKAGLVILLSFISHLCLSQFDKKSDVNLERLMDEIFPIQDEDFNYAELYEIYAQFLVNPLNLNTATGEQLRSLAILSPAQLNAFLQYRNENGPLLSIYELQVIPSFNDVTIKSILAFVTIKNQTTSWKNLASRMINEENNYFVTRVERTLEDKVGYTNDATPANHYLGSPYKLYNRFRTSSSGDFSFGFTTEKDPGEKMKWSPSTNQYGFDYISAHLQAQNKGFLNNLIIGDYQAQFGQGLTLGGGFGMGKGSETITTMRRSNIGFIPYTSASEFNFFRGVATSSTLSKAIVLHSFYSQVLNDGTLQTNDEGTETISSLNQSGFHRTTREINSRKNTTEQNFGGVIQFHRQSTDAGIIYHQTVFSKPIIPNGFLYNQFAFAGQQNRNVGLYLNQNIRNFSLFTEITHTLNNGTAGVIGLLSSISPSLDISLLYRRFDKNYYSFYSNAISEGTSPQNEEGFYWGWKYRFSKAHSTTGYVDLFRFPWLRFGSYRPSDGSEWMVRYNFTPNKNSQLFFQVRQENKVKNLGIDSVQYLTGSSVKTNFWLNADYSVSNHLRFKTRIQLVHYNFGNTTSRGFAILQDLHYRWNKLTLNARVALFDSDNYDSRLYIYEQDAWLAFTIPAFQGMGIREYILLQYKLNRKIDVWLRWAKTEYQNQETIGSGGETINGNQKNDFKVQVRIKL